MIEEQHQADQPDEAAQCHSVLAADAIAGEHAHAGHDHPADEQHEGSEVKQQETGEHPARLAIAAEGEGAEAHLAPAFVPQAGHRPGQQQSKRQPADRGLPHVGQAEREALAVAAPADAPPARARQAIAQGAEPRDSAEIEDRKQRPHAERRSQRLVAAGDQRLRNEAHSEIGHAEQHQHDDETGKQLHPGACPFEMLVDEPRARPQIAPLARGGPEPVDAQRDDRQQEVGQRDPRKILPVAFECESAVRAVGMVRPIEQVRVP